MPAADDATANAHPKHSIEDHEGECSNIICRRLFVHMVYQRIASIALVSVMAVSLLTACGEDTQSSTAGTSAVTESSTESQEETTSTAATVSRRTDFSTKRIGISIYQFSDEFMTLYRGELSDYLESLGFSADNIKILDAANDEATQLNQIRNFISDEVDVLLVNPVSASTAGDITDLAVEAGIPLVYVNRKPSESEQQRWTDNTWDVTYVGCDAAESGTMQGEIIAALDNQGDINGDGKVSYLMIEGDDENIDAALRTEYSVQALETAGINTECLADEVADWDRDDARSVAQAALEQYGTDIEVVFSNNDAMALGALEAIQGAGRTVGKDIYLVGVDALREACEDVIAGTMTGTVYNDYVAQSHAAADAAVNYIIGAGNEHYIGCDYLKVTAQNAQDVLDTLN